MGSKGVGKGGGLEGSQGSVSNLASTGKVGKKAKVGDIMSNAKSLMQEYFPNYKRELLGQRLLPRHVLEELKSALPGTTYEDLMRHHSVEGGEGTDSWGDGFSIEFAGGMCKWRRLRVCDLCQSKKAMALLYQLVATKKVHWPHDQDYLSYVHLLQGIGH